MQPRFLVVDSGAGPLSHVEVLERFDFHAVAREFNVRLRRGVWATNDALIGEIRKQFSIPAEFIGSVLPMAGDKTIRFDPKGGPSVSQIASDNRGAAPRGDVVPVGEQGPDTNVAGDRPAAQPHQGGVSPRRPSQRR